MPRDEATLLEIATAARLVLEFKVWKTANSDVPDLLHWLEPRMPEVE